MAAVQTGGMDYKTASLAYVRAVLAQKDITATELAKLVGKAPSTLTRPLSSPTHQYAIKLRTLEEIAEKTGVPLTADLRKAAAKKRPPAPEGRVELPIRYQVAAGSFLKRDEIPQEPYGFRRVPPAPGYEGMKQWLEMVQGESMNRLIPPGSLVHVVDAYDLNYRARHGDIVVVERERVDGSMVERTVKQVSIDGDRVELWPRSHSHRWQSALELTGGTTAGEEFTVTIVGKVVQSYQFWED
jgi:SOS-response transcriptional repressor LexA